MKFLITLFLATAVSASILPMKFNFGSHTPILKGVSQCPGHEDDVVVFVEGTIPETMCMPSTNSVDLHSLIKEDLPTDLIMFLDLVKVTPFEMKIPCLNGIGSCEYELCPMIENSQDTLCNTFPPTQPCSCPILASDLDLHGVQMEVQDMGPILGVVMEGDYRADATLYSASDKDRILGCVKFEFGLKKMLTHHQSQE